MYDMIFAKDSIFCVKYPSTLLSCSLVLLCAVFLQYVGKHGSTFCLVVVVMKEKKENKRKRIVGGEIEEE